MSDGMTDARQSTLTTERQRMLLRSVAACLEDWNDREKRLTAVNDILFHQVRLYAFEGMPDQETAAVRFLERLRRDNRQAWAQILAFALEDGVGSEFRELKNLSPFKTKTLVMALSTDSKLRLRNAQDLVAAIERLVPERRPYPGDYSKLVILNVSVEETVAVEG